MQKNLGLRICQDIDVLKLKHLVFQSCPWQQLDTLGKTPDRALVADKADRSHQSSVPGTAGKVTGSETLTNSTLSAGTTA